jgi:diadenosine tetraphosphate (Ap4A) HIT family hydrolase
MMNETVLKFGYPKMLLREYDEWVVLLRPQQLTLGCLILACKSEVTKLPDLSLRAFGELQIVTSHLEKVLLELFKYDKINYLLLMMRDRHVHFHVVPRYETERNAGGVIFSDASWPHPPDLTKYIDLESKQLEDLCDLLKSNLLSCA